MTDKEFNDIIEKLSRVWRKSFSETLRDLCNEAGISFRLILNNDEKKEIVKRILEKKESESIIPIEKHNEILSWVNKRRGKRRSE